MSEPTVSAVHSLLDVVQELVAGIAAGQRPDGEWTAIVANTFDKHRAELRGETVTWEGADDA